MTKNKIWHLRKKKSISFSLHLWLWRWCWKLGLGKMYSELFIPVVAWSCPSPLICAKELLTWSQGGTKQAYCPMRLTLALLTYPPKKKERKKRKEGRNYTSTDFFHWRFAIMPSSVFSGASRWKNCMIHFWDRSFFAFSLCNVWDVTHIS